MSSTRPEDAPLHAGGRFGRADWRPFRQQQGGGGGGQLARIVPGWGRNAPGSDLHETLHEAVFQGMKRNDDQPPARGEQGQGLIQGAFDFGEFIIHPYPQRLEAARCRIEARPIRRQNAANDAGELACGGDRGFCPRGDDGARNPSGRPFLTQLEQHVRELMFRQRIHEIRCCRPLAIHAHIQRSISAEREAAGWGVDLKGRHSQVQHHAVERYDIMGGE